MNPKKVTLAGSERKPLGTRVGDQPNDEMIEVSVILAPKLRALPQMGKAPISHADFAAKHGPDSAAIEKVRAFAK
jgi:hypothetical protein